MLESLIGKTNTVTTQVTTKNTAKAVGSGSLYVFSTPMMVALMEQAACGCFANSLAANETSVGTQVNVAHIAASKVGMEVSATATVTAVDGRKVSFDVVAHEGEKEVGKGTHERFVVVTEKFMARL